MATINTVNISEGMLRWAYQRAGFEEEEAVEAFPLLANWLDGTKKPTMNQLQKFAGRFYVPFGFLFLQQAPTEELPFPMFRGEAGASNRFDLNVYDTVMSVQSRQEWLEDYLTENEIDTCNIVGAVSLNTPIYEAVSKLRSALGLDARWAFSLKSPDAAVSLLAQYLEQIGIFVASNGIVGNNTHRPLKVSECRGFALVNDVAPYIFVNSADSKCAQLFTLIHEAAHIMLGQSAGHAGEDIVSHESTEVYCDKVAAEFLVPALTLREMWNEDVNSLSRRFKVSEIVIARRAHDLGLLTDDEYRAFWLSYRQRPIQAKKAQGGWSFYLTSVKRVGRTFAIHVRNAVNNRQLNYTEAYRLTGLYGRTYQQFMTNNI